ncbi:MAG: ribosome silencing factor [Deltaproteobacteria bacterium]|nr:ribosome silencing factor [Deltaproteobacteria bacterium]
MTVINNPGEANILDARKKALLIARIAEEKQAEDVAVLNIRKLSSFTDYLVICTVESAPQLKAVADEIDDVMRRAGERPLGVEGALSGRWALIDCNDVVAHVFTGPVREYYDIDGLWAEAVRLDVAAELKPKPVEKLKPVVKEVAKSMAKRKPVAKAAKKAVKAAVKKVGEKVAKAIAKRKPAVKKAVKKIEKKVAKAVAKRKPAVKAAKKAVQKAVKKAVKKVRKAVAKKR